jgi:hypothetical protein
MIKGVRINHAPLDKSNALILTSTDSPFRAKKTSLLCDTTSGDITITLNKASRAQYTRIVIKKVAVVNTVTIVPDGSDLIDGQSSLTLTNNGETAMIYCDGTTWTTQVLSTETDLMNEMEYMDITGNKGEFLVDDGFGLCPLTPGFDDQVVSYNSGGTAGVTNRYVNDLIKGLEYQITFGNHNNKAYAMATTSSYSTLRMFKFVGTDCVIPTSIKIIAETDKNNKYADVRVYDLTNSQIIAELTDTVNNLGIYDLATLSNLPSTEAMWEVQGRKSSSSGANLHIYSLSVLT